MIYREKEDRLHLPLGKEGTLVSLEINCFHGTKAGVSFKFNGLHTVSCGGSVPIGTDKGLPDNGSRLYIGRGSNPEGGTFKVEHIFRSSIGTLRYVFPDDYSGEPAYDPTDDTPTYRFTINFNRPDTDV